MRVRMIYRVFQLTFRVFWRVVSARAKIEHQARQCRNRNARDNRGVM